MLATCRERKFDREEIEKKAHGVFKPYPLLKPDADKKYKKRRPAFYTELIRKKVFLQPFHHGYIAATHTYEDLDYVVKAIEESLIECAKI